MVMKKADWVILKEAEMQGRVAGMTRIVESNRTDLNNALSNYFREQLPNYTGNFDEYDGEDVLYTINGYLQENKIDKHLLDFPMGDGTDVHLIPISENLQLEVVIADEYYGDGDYAKYVMINAFVINEKTTKKDVDALILFVRNHLFCEEDD